MLWLSYRWKDDKQVKQTTYFAELRSEAKWRVTANFGKLIMFSFYFTHVIRHSFREMRKSYVCKQLFDVSRTVRNFGRETVDDLRSLFDNYRVTHLKNVVKSSAIRNAFNWPLSTNDL